KLARLPFRHPRETAPQSYHRASELSRVRGAAYASNGAHGVFEPPRRRTDNRRVRIDSGRLFALFSFDLGFEIDLGRARDALPEGVRAGMGTSGKSAPAH